MLAESLLNSPANLTVHLRPVKNAPLPPVLSNKDRTVASVVSLSPVTFSAQRRLTSELLRFL